jgi:propanol-preferring alcohol dehydrogenase
MKAAQIVELRRPLRVTEVPDPVHGPQDAVVRVEAEGICRSDWHNWMGDTGWTGRPEPRLPLIPGHEFGGVVEEVGTEVRELQVGDRVTVPFHEACGHCAYCRSGHTNVCEDRQFIGFSHDGGYAEFVRIRNADFNCVKLPEAVDTLAASALGCRYMTAYHAVTMQGCARPGQWVAVHGTGGVGLSAVQIGNAVGAQVVAVDIDNAKLAKAEQEGAVATVNARDTDVPEAVREITQGGAHVSIDALGIRDTVLNSVLSLRAGGRHVQVGLTTKDERGMVALPIDFIVTKELRIVGSLGNPHPQYAGLLSLVERGKLRPKSIVAREVSLEEASDVLESMTHYDNAGLSVITCF